MQPLSEKELTADILRYLLEHPNAADEAEGILAWWYSEERMLVGLVIVRRILQNLAAKQMVIPHHLPGGRVVYSLNKERIEDIARFIEKDPD